MAESSVKSAGMGPFQGLFWAVLVGLGLLGAVLAVRSVRDAKNEVLLKSYVESDESERGEIARAIAADGDLGIARALRTAARNPGLRGLVPDLVGRLPREALGERTRAWALETIRAGDPVEADLGLSVMAALGEEAVPPLEALLWNGPSEEVAARCLRGLMDAGERGRRAVVSYHVGYFQHSDRDLRKDAALELARLGEEATPELLETLGDPEEMVRLFVATTMGVIRDERSIQGLIRALRKEPDLGVKVAIGSALTGITGETTLGHDADAWQAHYDTYRDGYPAQLLPSWAE